VQNNAPPCGPSHSQTPDDAKTILENVFDLAIQHAEASGKDPKIIDMVRKIGKFYSANVKSNQPLLSPKELLNILRSNSPDRNIKIKKSLSLIVNAWIKREVQPSSIDFHYKLIIMTKKDVIVEKLADKLIAAYDAAKSQIDNQTAYIQQPLPTPTSTIGPPTLKTNLDVQPKKTDLPPKQKNPRASAPPPIQPPPSEIESSTILLTDIFNAWKKVTNDTQDSLHNIN